MEPEKTILQQIRDKENEYAMRLEGIRAETDASVAVARKDAAELISAAEDEGKKAAEQIFLEEKDRAAREIETLKNNAVRERDTTAKRGAKNLPGAVEKITAYVTMR